MDTITLIRQTLDEQLSPQELQIEDESHLHIGHQGAKGGGHFAVYIVSPLFSGKSRIERHRMVNEATKHLFGSAIHALKIDAKTPDETI